MVYTAFGWSTPFGPCVVIPDKNRLINQPLTILLIPHVCVSVVHCIFLKLEFLRIGFMALNDGWSYQSEMNFDSVTYARGFLAFYLNWFCPFLVR